MTRKPPVCRDIEMDLVAVATGDAGPGSAERVEDHVSQCTTCRTEFDRYRTIDRVVGKLRTEAGADDDPARARAALESELADLRRRLVVYGIFASPLGHIMIARSEEGVALVQYLGRATRPESTHAGLELQEDLVSVKPLHRELMEYLEGKRRRLEWALDLRTAHSDFHRSVLRATAAVPYGSVTSYAAIAREIGRPAAVRAVAQALRWNPLPIVIPCHRIVGSSGALTGYAGNRIGLKQRILDVEGVPTHGARVHTRIAREQMYAARRGDTEYCLPTCGSLPTLTLAGLTLFSSGAKAERAGFTPCQECRPDLHPLAP
jgi:methylated-DNA-[protein]-cysteine S-methyltransferase